MLPSKSEKITHVVNAYHVSIKQESKFMGKRQQLCGL